MNNLALNDARAGALTGKHWPAGWPGGLEKYAATHGGNRQVAGRAEALTPLNHTGFALNQTRKGSASRLRYIEVTHGQHFDAFLALSGFPTRFIPLHIYAGRAPDAMRACLTILAAQPDSRQIRTPPSAAGDNLEISALQPFAAVPAADAIRYNRC